MRFVDRLEEMARLDALVARRQAGLVAVWGRRRVGKTRLLLEWCRRHDGLYTVADQSAPAIQRRYLAEALASQFPGLAEVEYPDWRSLLRAVARQATAARWRGPIILDEFPYLVAASPVLPSVLQGFIDHEASAVGLLMVIAGSSQHMMQGLALASSSPLYGRAIEAFALQPMRLGHMGEALGLADPVACVRAFSVWGGVPRYWELTEQYGENLDRAVDALVLDPLGPLHDEPARILADEVPPAISLRPLLDAIGAGAHRVSEIAGRLGQPATSLSRPLSRLVELGLVRREQPFGESERGGKRALYTIADPFFAFWFRVVAPRRGALASLPRRARMETWKKAAPGLVAGVWEALCRETVPRLMPDQWLPASVEGFGPAGRHWRAGMPEWDVVAASSDGGTLLLGEAKWREAPATEADLGRMYRELLAKGCPSLPDRRPVEVVYALFVPRLASTGRRSRPFAVLTAEDVVNALR